MEQIKESFKHDYNLAVRSFNEKDYKSFFRNIRPAMELLGQLSIYDILGESDAVDLLEGDTSVEWKRDAKIYKISQYPSNHKPTGSNQHLHNIPSNRTHIFKHLWNTLDNYPGHETNFSRFKRIKPYRVCSLITMESN